MDTNKAKIISFINLKGGVGKTSTAINIADAFSRTDHKVLVIDMDPQFNATQALLNHQFRHHKKEIESKLLAEVLQELSEKYEEVLATGLAQEEYVEEGDLSQDENYKKEISSQLIYNKLKAKGMTVRTLFTNEGIVEPLEQPSLIYNIKNNLDLIPGDLDLFESLYGDTSGKHNVLEDHFESFGLRKIYDYIIIDCPPNWTILTQASLFASDYYIIPSKVDLFSSVGIGLLENLVKTTFYEKKSGIFRLYTVYRKELGLQPIKSLGVLFTLTHDMPIAAKLKERLQRTIPQSFFETEIPYHSSVPLKFSLYDESGTKHDALKNSITRVVLEITGRVSSLEEVYENS
ncbi:ParA family protein [Aneurinibacillus aneurinilyticus]|jgi:chromosome partitioning protein|uniref:ParA family protein n=1 Tax=Aneurinibacillus aneurinilyticus TaxID=1391 RepID=UPI0023F9E05F|nr:AAA family ATPase [Aneurinibacillus aneurinilyticus]MCI1696807.1 AAA family ATPase [Aneurinibacillus aneurinilyticus]